MVGYRGHSMMLHGDQAVCTRLGHCASGQHMHSNMEKGADTLERGGSHCVHLTVLLYVHV
jgi:hypothetical protein